MANLQDTRTEGDVVQVMKDWATSHPEQVVAFDLQMRQLRDMHRKSDGWSEHRQMRRFGEIPTTLNYMMQSRFGKTWHQDKRLRTYFWDNFKIGKIRKQERVLHQDPNARSV